MIMIQRGEKVVIVLNKIKSPKKEQQKYFDSHHKIKYARKFGILCNIFTANRKQRPPKEQEYPINR